MLAQNLSRLNEEVPEEKSGVFNTLGVLENFFEAAMEKTVKILLDETQLLPWILNRLKRKEFDEVKACGEPLDRPADFPA